MDRRTFIQHIGMAGVGASAALLATTPEKSVEAEGGHEVLLPMVTVGDPTGPASILVAASNAPAAIQGVAHYACNGIDDQVTINQALTDLSVTGGVIQLSEGTFNCTGAIRLPRRTALIGKGRATILKAFGTWSAVDGSLPGAVVEPAGTNIDKTRVANLSINGNRWDATQVKGIYYNITSDDGFDEGPDAAHVFSHLYIYHTYDHGFHMEGSRNRAVDASHIRVYNVGSEGVNEAHGFFHSSPDSFYSHCESGSSSGSGFYVDGANNRFTNCKSWYSDLSGWQIRKPRNQFSACESQDNEQHGYYITTGPNSLVACHADSNSWNSATPTSLYDGFHMPWGNRIQLIGCSAYDKDEGGRGNWQRYGFFLGTTVEHTQIMGTADSNVTAATGGTGVGNGSNTVMVAG